MTFHVSLTSFVEAQANYPNDDHWSGARFAPDFAKDWPIARWAQPKDREQGFAWKLREFGGEGMDKVNTYFHYALREYRERWPEIRGWLNGRQTAHRPATLSCWCPYSKTAQAQLDQFGTFHCHLGVIGHIFETIGVPWSYGPEHEMNLVRHGQ